MKKIYVSPKIQVLSLRMCNMLAGGASAIRRHKYRCPYIPDTECEMYDMYVMNKIGKGNGSLKIFSEGNINIPCPYSDTCEDYDLFCKITNERQR